MCFLKIGNPVLNCCDTANKENVDSRQWEGDVLSVLKIVVRNSCLLLDALWHLWEICNYSFHQVAPYHSCIDILVRPFYAKWNITSLMKSWLGIVHLQWTIPLSIVLWKSIESQVHSRAPDEIHIFNPLSKTVGKWSTHFILHDMLP